MYNPLKIIKDLVTSRSTIGMWKRRSKQYGPRAALNIGHSDEEIGAVTEMQREKIFPSLKQALTGHEETILDLGCGPGRFTPGLAELIQGNAIGVDPIQHFLDMAPKHKNVQYKLMEESNIPVIDNSINVVWICLVLGGIIEKHVLRDIVSEVDRILRDGVLIALIENTTDTNDRKYWKFRSVGFYQSLFGFAELKQSSDYYDLGERISITAGMKHV